MKHASFFWFVLPSSIMMLLFIAFPVVSVVVQSLYQEHEQVIIEVENCGPFGCNKSTGVDVEATQALREAQPLGQWAGLDIYKDTNHLAFAEVGEAWTSSVSTRDFVGSLMNLQFYRALAFTLTYTAIVTPLTIILGFLIAIGVNTVARAMRGPTIFLSLLPMIVTPHRGRTCSVLDGGCPRCSGGGVAMVGR